MSIRIRRKRKEKKWAISGNKPKEYLWDFMQETEEEMFDAYPGQDPIGLGLVALHAMMKPRLEVIIALLLDLRDKEG